MDLSVMNLTRNILRISYSSTDAYLQLPFFASWEPFTIYLLLVSTLKPVFPNILALQITT